MNVIKIGGSSSFEIVPRKKIDLLRSFKIKLTNEFTGIKEEVIVTFVLIENENYIMTLATFPLGNIGEKISYSVIDTLTSEILFLGKLIIISATQSVQDYEKTNCNKFYK